MEGTRTLNTNAPKTRSGRQPSRNTANRHPTAGYVRNLAGGVQLSRKTLSKLRGLREKVVALNARHNYQRRPGAATIIDSGATVHLVKSKKWLRRLCNRLKAITVRTATGEPTRASLGGPLRIFSQNKEGNLCDLGDIGAGHVLENLTFSLLSVSMLCKRGCTVVFKPKRAYMRTPSGHVIPFSEQDGLYCLPTHLDEVSHLPGATGRAYCVHRRSKDDRKRHLRRSVAKTLRALRLSRYGGEVCNSMSLTGASVAVCGEARRAAVRVRVCERHITAHKAGLGTVAAVTRAQRKRAAAKDADQGAGSTSDSDAGWTTVTRKNKM